MRLFKRHRDDEPKEAPCPRCGVPAPVGATDCMACGWDLRETYQGPVGRHEETTPSRSLPGTGDDD